MVLLPSPRVMDFDTFVLPDGVGKILGLTVASVVFAAILRVVLARPRRGSVVWVVAVLALATCPAFVGSPYRLKLANAAKDAPWSSRWADFTDQFKTASVAGAVAFFMNCGIQGVDANPSTLSAYPVAATPVMEQRMNYEQAPLTYEGVQQQLFTEDYDAAIAQRQHLHSVAAPRANLRAVESPNAVKEARMTEAKMQSEEDPQLKALEGRILEEKMRLNAAEEHLKTLEEDLQAAKVKKAMQEAASPAAVEPEAASGGSFFGNDPRDWLLLGCGAILGAVGHGLVKMSQKWSSQIPMPTMENMAMPSMPSMPTMPTMPSMSSSMANSGALGLAFTASVYSTAPALSTAPVHVPTAGSAAVATTLPLLTMRGAGLVDSEASSPSSSPLYNSPFVLQ